MAALLSGPKKLRPAAWPGYDLKQELSRKLRQVYVILKF